MDLVGYNNRISIIFQSDQYLYFLTTTNTIHY